MMKPVIVSLLLLFSAVTLGFTQGQGGGVYMEDNASCIGSVVYENRAVNGFGVAGGDGLLLNATVVGNLKLHQDTTDIVPGNIYCANGDIVDTLAYKKRVKKDAIGVVYWVGGNLNNEGAVVALQETTGSWGELDGLNICQDLENGEEVTASGGSLYYMKDTACYGNTKKMYEKAMESSNNRELYRAGYYCYTYQALRQSAGHPVRWCLPVYMHIRRIFGMLPVIESTLNFLKKEHQGESDFSIDFFINKREVNCWYWSSDDYVAGLYEHALMINFKTGANGKGTEANTLKNAKNNIRPIFLYQL